SPPRDDSRRRATRSARALPGWTSDAWSPLRGRFEPTVPSTRARNRGRLALSMGRTPSARRGGSALPLGLHGLREPLRDVLGLDDDLLVDLPRPVLLDQGVELVLGQAERVGEPILRGEDVRHAGRLTLDLPRVDLEVEDLHVRRRHEGLL